jgi:poly(3-hydroxybutyrate) depolymerase
MKIMLSYVDRRFTSFVQRGLSVLLCFWGMCAPAWTQESSRRTLEIPSRAGAATQPIAVIEPANHQDIDAIPLVVSLHTWSGDWQQRHPELEAGAAERGWLVLQPNFHGPNRIPLACGSQEAQVQILEAVQWCCENYPVDRRRIYLTGVSGGGHMTLLMAGRYPRIWAAASAWVGISDLQRWFEFHDAKGGRYAKEIEAACGGRPGSSRAVDLEYQKRSPLSFLSAAKQLPLDIAAGIHDGHTGSVPVSHSLLAFNELAMANGESGFDEKEIETWCQKRTESVGKGGVDSIWMRAVHLRRTTGKTRITLFEGGHEGLAVGALDFLAQHQKELPVQFDASTLTPTPLGKVRE